MRKKFDSLRILKATLFLFLIPCALRVSSAMASEKKEFVIGINFPSSMGVSSSQMYDMANGVIHVINDGLSVKCRLERFESMDAMTAAFERGTIDGEASINEQVVESMDRGVVVKPWATLAFEGKTRQSFCLWYAKERPLRSVSEIVGKTIADSNFTPLYLARIRSYLVDHGIDQPLWKTFDSFVVVPGLNSAFMALAMGKVDVMWNIDSNRVTMKLMSPATMAKLAYGFCDAGDSMPASVVFNKNVSAAAFAELKRKMANFKEDMIRLSKTDSSVLQMRQYLMMTRSQMEPADANGYAADLKLYRKAKANGWMDEARFIMEMIDKTPPGKPVHVSTNYKYCRKRCLGKPNTAKCMDGCMASQP